MDNTFGLFKDPLFWIALVSALSAFALYIINKKTFKLLYKKPEIKIIDISLEPRKSDGQGGLESDCLIRIRVINPSSFGNYISGTLKRFPFYPSITNTVYGYDKHQEGDCCYLPEFGKIYIVMYLDYEKVKKYENKRLLLIIKDIRGKKVRKYFTFKNIGK